MKDQLQLQKKFDPIVASLVSKSETCNEHELLSHVVSIYLRVDKNFELLRHRNMYVIDSIHLFQQEGCLIINLKRCCTAHNSKRRDKKYKSLARLIPIDFDFRFFVFFR